MDVKTAKKAGKIAESYETLDKAHRQFQIEIGRMREARERAEIDDIIELDIQLSFSAVNDDSGEFSEASMMERIVDHIDAAFKSEKENIETALQNI
ncbi:MAG: hypothetical protein GVY20_02010 [Bacteroidetes bacterium]|jgi:hypothetical protein|nr:hypothetical protein [Bacteroidota bacterium]